MMPQGVEHVVVLLGTRNNVIVVFPLMPQGVEHIAKNEEIIEQDIGGFSVDAARR